MIHTQEEIDAAKKMIQDDMGCECNQPMIDMVGEDNGATTFKCWNCGHVVVYFKENNYEK